MVEHLVTGLKVSLKSIPYIYFFLSNPLVTKYQLPCLKPINRSILAPFERFDVKSIPHFYQIPWLRSTNYLALNRSIDPFWRCLKGLMTGLKVSVKSIPHFYRLRSTNYLALNRLIDPFRRYLKGMTTGLKLSVKFIPHFFY
jgi:hypothetical protein